MARGRRQDAHKKAAHLHFNTLIVTVKVCDKENEIIRVDQNYILHSQN